jgi:hypothetical protein
LWTLLITPALPIPGNVPLGTKYQTTFIVLAVVLVVGFGWDVIYYGLQQFRWEKDWPTMFLLLNGINEGIVAWLIVQTGNVPGHPMVTLPAFVIQFGTVWVITWGFVNGPMRVPFLRWRFRGGRLI